jgi:hypothetical protein
MDAHLVPADGDRLNTADDPLMARLRSMYDAIDPVPEHLADGVVALIAIANLDIEVGLLGDERSSVRGPDDSTLTVTFHSAHLTTTLRLDRRIDGTMRVDGTLAPPAVCEIELRTDTRSLRTRSDTNGRFAFDGATPGLAYITIRGMLGDPIRPTTVTQPVVL